MKKMGGKSMWFRVGEILDLLELSARDFEKLRKVHNDTRPEEVMLRNSCRHGSADAVRS